MPNHALLELQIDSRDETIVKEVETNLASVEVTRWETARMDPVTVLAIAAAAVKLISALLELKAKLARKPGAPKVAPSMRATPCDRKNLAGESPFISASQGRKSNQAR